MATSEIEKLERRYTENPQGLTFAPLAEVHRKNGDVARALELLQAGLELHPNYIPASIVLGRCHWDLGDLPAAESAFAHVLRLDDENVIALKSLADINERLERFGEAKRWLHRLVSVDRSNEEARQQLSRLETSKEQGDQAAGSPPEAPVEAGRPPAIAAVKPAPAREPASVAPAALEPSAPAEIAPIDLTAELAEPASPSKAEPREGAEPKPVVLQFLDTSEPVQKSAEPALPTDAAKPVSSGEPIPLAGLISQEFEPPKKSTFRLHPEFTQFDNPGEPPARFDVETPEDVQLQSSGASEFRVPNAAEDFMDARVSSERTDAAPAAVSRPAEVELVATETMAEVLVQQGHAADALRIYRELARRSPEDARLRARIEELEATVARVAALRPSYSTRDTHGQSVVSFFQGLLAARPPENSSPPVSHSSPPSQGGAPTRPAQDAVSLSSVFGQESPPVSPGVPAAGPAKDVAVSFDDFFGSPAGGSSSQTPGSAGPSNDDLDQFQTWLQNLKR
jgi:tetratricopeptide (TPR) repeat protein